MERKIKVLFIDDDTALGNIVTLALQEFGFEAIYFSTLIGITAFIREFTPDVIVLDVEIGNKNGIDALPAIQEVAPQTPVIFVSSHHDTAMVVQALRQGGFVYLKKPFEIEELIAYIERLAQTAKPSHQIEFDCFRLDIERSILLKNNNLFSALTPFECRLLRLLASHLGQIVPREKILEELWHGETTNDKSLNNYVNKLRKMFHDYPRIRINTYRNQGIQLILLPK